MENKDRSTNKGETQVCSNNTGWNSKFFIEETLLQFDLPGVIVNIIVDYHRPRPVYFLSITAAQNYPIRCDDLNLVLELISKLSHSSSIYLFKERHIGLMDDKFPFDEKEYDGLICSGHCYQGIMQTLSYFPEMKGERSECLIRRFPLLGLTFKVGQFSIYLEFLNNRTIANSESSLFFIYALFWHMNEPDDEPDDDIFAILKILRNEYSDPNPYIKPLPSVLVIWQNDIASCSSGGKKVIYEAERSNAAKNPKRILWDSILENSSMFLILFAKSAGNMMERLQNKMKISFIARTYLD